MTRLTRSQAQDRNRDTVLAVARDAFLRDGYVATSVAAVAREAGFTTGIVYSSFGSKAELALGVLRGIQTEQIDALAGRVRDADGPDQLLPQVREWAKRASDSGWVRFELELLLETIGDEKLAAAQTQRQAAALDQAAEVIRMIVPGGAIDDGTIEVLAEAVVDYAIGVGIRSVVNREASPDRFLELVGPLFTALTSA
ncbi:hypothetical protein C6I20_11200 [Aeromicrobium sp. A1-2]|uniref:TetR/AcrR family transcriptional regulator n=1 Tax=Aeromicrobium sp. A1-2 TaxID=2107713 RepID=UPI000E51D6B1|nr:TetR/AcrR family transcriptional regulator [Aeromicrobium sp. A1-2]AXT85699.1 hypothetical protein C6I20_11200 [Aeromicrobium sp. A1-2]